MQSSALPTLNQQNYYKYFLLSTKKSNRVDQINKTLFECDVNDDRCCSCQRAGELFCCDTCFRSMHLTCREIELVEDKHWSCYSCVYLLKCSYCYKQTGLANDFICTVCYRACHKECQLLPEEVFTLDYFFKGKYNYCCNNCVVSYGVQEVLAGRKMQSNNSSVVLLFVRLKTVSPIHCTWVSSEILNQCRRNPSKRILDGNIYRVPKIERVLKMRPPWSQMGYNIDKMIKELLVVPTNPFRYGSKHNYSFLVKWVDMDYSKLTWYDESIIVRWGSCSLKKYLLYKKQEVIVLESGIIYKRSLFSGLGDTINAAINSLDASSSNEVDAIRRNLSTTYQYPAPIILVQRHKSNKTSSRQTNNEIVQYAICGTIMKFYIKNQCLYPAIIVVDQQYVLAWEATALKICTMINVLVFHGMVGNIVSIMKHAFGYPGTGYVKFHVLVISYQHFDEYRKEILEKIPSFSFIIIKKPNSDFNYFRDFSMVDKNNYTVNRKIIILEDKPLHFKTIYSLSCYKMFWKYSIEINLLEKINVETNKYKYLKSALDEITIKDVYLYNNKKQYKYNEMQRLIFLRLIIAYGFNFPSILDLFKIVSGKFKSVFGSSTEYFEVFNSYTTGFIALLNDSIQLGKSYKYYYLFNIYLRWLKKRVVDLSCLQQFVEQSIYYNNVFPADNFYFDQQLFFSWSHEYDLVLASLILRYGYGNWQAILNAKDWSQYRAKLGNYYDGIEVGKMTFGHFLYLNLRSKSAIGTSNNTYRRKYSWYEKLIEARGYYLLTKYRC